MPFCLRCGWLGKMTGTIAGRWLHMPRFGTTVLVEDKGLSLKRGGRLDRGFGAGRFWLAVQLSAAPQNKALLGGLQFAVLADYRVRRTVVFQVRLRGALELGNDALRENLTKFDAPLVKRIDLPDCALREDGVLVQCDQLAERFGREFFEKNGVRRAVTLEYAVRNKPIWRAFRLHLLGSFAERQGFALRADVGNQHVMVTPQRIQGFAEGNKIAGN